MLRRRDRDGGSAYGTPTCGQRKVRLNPTNGFEWPSWTTTETHYLSTRTSSAAFLAVKRPLNEHVARELAGILHDYLLARGMPGPLEPLLVDRHGTRWGRSGLTQLMQRIGKAAGIERIVTSAHRLRHTANVLARYAGIDPFSRSRLMGQRAPRPWPGTITWCPASSRRTRERQRAALESYVKRGASE